MVDKFFIDILEDTLKKHHKFQAYKEELEKQTSVFHQNIDNLFDSQSKGYIEAGETPQDTPPPEEPAKEGTEKKDNFEIPTEEKDQLVRGCNFAAQAVLFSYAVAGIIKRVKKISGDPTQLDIPLKRAVDDIEKEIQSELNKLKKRKTYKEPDPITIQNVFGRDLTELMPLKDKMVIFFFKQNLGDVSTLLNKHATDADKEQYLQFVDTHLSNILSKLTGAKEFRAFINQFIISEGDSAAQLYKAQMTNQQVTTDDMHDKVLGVLTKIFPEAKKFDTFRLGESEHETVTLQNVFHILKQHNLYDDLMDNVHEALKETVPGLQKKLNAAANAFFKDKQRVSAVNVNEEVDNIIDESFNSYVETNQRQYSKEEIFNMYMEATPNPLNAPLKADPNDPNQVPAEVKKTGDKLSIPGKTDLKEEKPKQIKQQKPEEKEFKTQPFQVRQTESLRQAMVMTMVGVVATMLDSLQRTVKKTIVGATGVNEEEIYDEGIVLKLIDKVANAAGASMLKLAKMFTGFKPDFQQFENKDRFDQFMTSIINKLGTGALQNELKAFKFDKIIRDFDERVFNPEKLKQKNTQNKIKASYDRVKNDIVSNISNVTITDLQNLIEKAWDSQAGAGEKAAKKVFSGAQKLATKLRV